jgi:hypothetical protein
LIQLAGDCPVLVPRILKRGIAGTYVSVEPFHLYCYLDEQTFRYNHSVGFKDQDRFDVAVRQIVDKRLT